MEAPADWPFKVPPDVAVITLRTIMDGMSWIALVSHDEDDEGWQFIGPEGAFEEQAMVVGLVEVLRMDDSIVELADLPLGWKAWRQSPDAPWQRGPRR